MYQRTALGTLGFAAGPFVGKAARAKLAEMEHLIELKPMEQLQDPVLLTGFFMRRRAGRLASRTLAYLADQWGAEKVAKLELNEFVNATIQRPEVRRDDNQVMIDWPELSFYHARPPGANRDIILLMGAEPNYYWMKFVETISEYVERTGAKTLVSLRARPGEVPHTRTSPVYIIASDVELELQFGVQSTAEKYEGPSSISGVLSAHLQTLNWRTADLSVVQPDYFPRMPNAQASLSLIRLIDKAFGTTTPVESLEETAREQRRTIDEGIANDETTWSEILEREGTYDSGLENLEFLAPAEAPSDELPSIEAALEDVERLFRSSEADDKPSA